MEESYTSLCEGVLGLDAAIRMVGVTNEVGSLLAATIQRGLLPLLNKEEIQRYVATAIMGTQIRQMFEQKIGKLSYLPMVYEKTTIATIPVAFGRDRQFFLFASMVPKTDYRSIVEQKVMPFIVQNKADFI
jgi:hypothetical protein